MADFDRWNHDERIAYVQMMLGTVIGGMVHLIDIEHLRRIVSDFAHNDFVWDTLRKAVTRPEKSKALMESMKDLVLKFTDEPNLKLVDPVAPDPMETE